MKARILFFLGNKDDLSFEGKNILEIEKIGKQMIRNHELATLVMGDLEDILYSAVSRVMNELFRE